MSYCDVSTFIASVEYYVISSILVALGDKILITRLLLQFMFPSAFFSSEYVLNDGKVIYVPPPASIFYNASSKSSMVKYFIDKMFLSKRYNLSSINYLPDVTILFIILYKVNNL